MMKVNEMDYAIWNVLHDGGVERVTGSVPGEVVVRVGIPYLCEEWPTAEEYLDVHLKGCTRFEFYPFGGAPVCDLVMMNQQDIEVGSAELVAENVAVCCVKGMLSLAYETVEVRSAENRVLSQAGLQEAARRYWNKWKAKSKLR